MNKFLFSLLVPATIVFFSVGFNEKAEATEAEPQLMRTRVFVSSIIQAPVDEVWAIVRDFNGLPDWHPVIADSRIEGNKTSDSIGSIRNFHLVDGANFREKLLTLSDIEHMATYTIVESPLPIENYVATLRLSPVTDGNHTYWEWSADFFCAPEDEAMLIELVGNGVFQTGFDSLKEHFSKKKSSNEPEFIKMDEVFVSSVIHAPVEKVWAVVRDFNGMPDWHPVVADSRIEDNKASDSVGSIRNFHLADGANFREQLLTLSDIEHMVTYTIVESPLPIENYIATLRLLPVTDDPGSTYAEWTARFNSAPEDEAGLIELVANGVFQTGFDSLNEIFD